MKAHKRFDTALRAADIPATLADAATSLGTVGGMFRSIDQTLTLATARALIDATQPDADLDAVFGMIGAALDESGLASGPARVADKMLAQAARFAAKHDGPIKPGAALREAQELTAAVFGHETKRREDARKKRIAAAEERKAKAEKAEADAKKKAEKAEAEAEEAKRDPLAESPDALVVGGTVAFLDEGKALALSEILRLLDGFESPADAVEAVRHAQRDFKAKASSLRVA